VSVRILPIEGLPEVRPGDDLAALLSPPLRRLGPRDGDVVVVTQKVVSKAEGRIVPDEGLGRSAWVERESVRLVARRGDVLIAETRHGFVCANAGVDSSNVDPGFVTLLPEDPDGSAERLRKRLSEDLDAEIAVVITDTFGRAWRRGVVNVAIGCAGLPALVDLRGLPDDRGRALEATIVALADEVAAATGLTMGKAARVPAVLVRGVSAEAPPSPAAEIVRPPIEDLFRESPLLSISSRRTKRSFGDGPVPREALEEAVRAACTASVLDRDDRPWRFSVLESPSARRVLIGAIAEARGADQRDDGVPEDAIDPRIAADDAVLGSAPVLIVPWVRLADTRPSPGDDRAGDERELLLLSSGAAIENLLLALHAQGLASCWTRAGLFRQEETRAVLGVEDAWQPLGTIAVGPMPPGEPPPRPAPDLSDVLRIE
jgi:coenzyme F420-0:L-glutamate ligase/coenzyme F420-1:gamma-L-glutamate ligase